MHPGRTGGAVDRCGPRGVTAMSRRGEPLWPDLEQMVRNAQPPNFEFPKPESSGWIGPIHSPFRSDRRLSFHLRPDGPHDPGAWKDHATGERGTMKDLAERIGQECLEYRERQAVGGRWSPWIAEMI